mmetsp:Transcript_32981/g.77064  ORF Transcript_32981/g.77064 Transcript_32981/m.77064 type:complete len:525 (-) Transcript_32981:218-1792(-)
MAAVIAARSAEARRRQRNDAEAEVQQEAAAAGGVGGSGTKKFMLGRQKVVTPIEDMSWRDRIWTALDDPASSRPAYSFSIAVLLLIVLSCSAFVVETIPSMCCGRYDLIWNTIETVCVAVFSVEYVMRIGVVMPRSSNEGMFSVLPEERNHGPWAEVMVRIRFFTGFLNLVDFTAIFPTWLQFFLGPDADSGGGATQFLRVIRLARVFRLFKLSKYSEGMWLLSATMVRSWRALGMLGFLMLIAVVLFSSVMYFVERGEFYYCDQESMSRGLCLAEQLWPPDVTPVGTPLLGCGKLSEKLHGGDELCCRKEGWYIEEDLNEDGCIDRSQFDSIVATAWWCVVTMTTVGYGDVVPHNPLGQLLATVTMLSGILILALPITVIGSNFNIEYEKKEAEKRLNEEFEAMMQVENEHEAAAKAAAIMSPARGGDAGEGAGSALNKSGEPPSPSTPSAAMGQSMKATSVHDQQQALLGRMQVIMDQQQEIILKRAEELIALHVRQVAREVAEQSALARGNGLELKDAAPQ